MTNEEAMIYVQKTGLNGYVANYRGKSIDVFAKTSYEAQTKAAAQFKAKKSYEVSVNICITASGGEVIYNGSEF